MVTPIPPGGVSSLQAYYLDIPALSQTAPLSVRHVHIHECLGEPYTVTVEVTTPLHLDLLATLDSPASFSVSPVDATAFAAGLSFDEATLPTLRRWAGVVREVTRVAFSADESVFEIKLAPRIARLADRVDTRLFQNQDIPAVIREVMKEDIGLLGNEVQVRTTRAYPVLEHITQYNETSLAFITRLCESCGLFYYFEQADDHEIVVFADDQSHYLKALQVHQYRPDSGLESTGIETVKDIKVSARPVNGQIERLDYNHRTSGGADLMGSKTAGGPQNGLAGRDYRWGSHHKDPSQGQDVAQLIFEINQARQIQSRGEANVVRFAPALIFRTDGPTDPLAEFGWVITCVEHTAARDRAWTSRFTAIPAERIYRLEQKTPKPTIAGTIPARITSPSRYANAYINEHGLYRVTFLYDQKARDKQWPPAGSSRLMRLARPYAGDTYGLHFPLIDGTEVQVAFQNGDIDRPYIAHALHDQTKPDHVTNKNHTRNIIRTPTNNKIRLEDRDNEQHIKISTEYGKSQVNLGHLVDAQRQKRGDGFELRTDGWGALRAGRGIFVSADAQPRAQGEQLEMQPALDQIRRALQQAQALSDANETAQAQSLDIEARQVQLKSVLDSLQEAAIFLSAPAGIAAATPKDIQLTAQENHLFSAGGNAEYSILKKLTMAVGEAISLCAHKLGIQIIANKGKVQIQAQSGEIELTAVEGLRINSTEQHVIIQGKKGITLVDGGGAYIKLENGVITLGAPNPLQIKTTLNVSGKGYMPATLPSFKRSDICIPCLLDAARRGSTLVPA